MADETKKPETLPAYRPFSNGSEYEGWVESNCSLCVHASDSEDMPVCCGEHGLMLAMIGDGTVPVMALDFIGTSRRDVQITDNEKTGFCTLSSKCAHLSVDADDDYSDQPDGVTIQLEGDMRDSFLAQAVADGFEKYGYKLTDKINAL